MKTIEHFVNGKSFSGSSKKTSDVFNPATGEISAKVNLATKKDVDDAVEIASKAFVTWSQVPPLQRARILFKFKELIEKNSDELTKIIVSEHGKVYDDAKGSLTRGLEVVEFACGIPHLLKSRWFLILLPDSIKLLKPSTENYTVHLVISILTPMLNCKPKKMKRNILKRGQMH